MTRTEALKELIGERSAADAFMQGTRSDGWSREALYGRVAPAELAVLEARWAAHLAPKEAQP